MMTQQAHMITFDENVVSDLHKDAYGFRPSATWWAQWRVMSTHDKQAEWDRLCTVLETEDQRRSDSEARAHERWSAHIAQLMQDNGIDRATAVRWDMQAQDAENDTGYYCFQWGISFANESEINKLLNGK